MEFDDDGSLAKNPVSERLTARGARSIPVLDERSMTQNSEAALTPLRPPSPAPHQNRIYITTLPYRGSLCIVGPTPIHDWHGCCAMSAPDECQCACLTGLTT